MNVRVTEPSPSSKNIRHTVRYTQLSAAHFGAFQQVLSVHFARSWSVLMCTAVSKTL